MPLPPNSALSILGASRPGDALHSKPKQAMLVRMSSEMLDALESFTTQPQLQFEFGENSGMHIGQTFFPMGHYQENTIHELYLRASSASKKNAPLKLYANVIGKFALEQRELAEEIRDKIRESTQDAAAQRNSRTTVFMETPPEPQPMGKKRKELPGSSMFRKPLRPADKAKPVPPAPTPPSITKPSLSSSSSASQSQRDGAVPLRKRLIHCIAHGDKSEEQLFKMLGASDPHSSLRPEIHDLLDQLAELRSSKLYQLKPIAWKEVRPFEWPGLAEQERVQMARTAQMTLKNLRVPESDPVWNHFQTKSSPASTSTSSDNKRPPSSSLPAESASKQDAPKRGVSSREVKEKKMKPKPDPKAEIMMKDESIRATPQPRPSDNSNTQNDSTSARRQPPASTKPVKSNARQSAADGPSAPSPREKPITPRQELLSHKTTTHQTEERPPKLKKVRRENASDSERERPKKIKERLPRREVEDSDYADSKPSTSSKRRQLEDGEYVEQKPKMSKRKEVEPADSPYDDHVAPPKKRRTEQHSISSISRDERERRESAPPPRKSNLSTRPNERDPPIHSSISKNKKMASPPPIRRNPLVGKDSSESRPQPKSASSSVAGSKSSKSSGPIKPRRRSPVYTSSDDEKEALASSKRVSAKASASVPVTSAPAMSHISRKSMARPLPTDHAGLRARYDASYVDYLNTFQRLVIQKGKIDRMLKNDDIGSAGSITDSDGDVELLPHEELERLTVAHKRLHDELETIQKIFERTKVELASD